MFAISCRILLICYLLRSQYFRDSGRSMNEYSRSLALLGCLWDVFLVVYIEKDGSTLVTDS